MKIRLDVVFDCNVLFQAMTRATGPAARALSFVEEQRITLHVSRSVLKEFRRILDYPEIRAKNPQMTPRIIEAFIERLCFRGKLSRLVSHAFDLPRDPGDEPYIDLAAAVDADYLVTWDNDLLSLMTEQSASGNEFRKRFSRLKIVHPVAFVDIVLKRNTNS